jgi:hypothetical protein
MTVPAVLQTSEQDATGPYRLVRPTLHEAYSALYGLYGPHTDDVWRTLLSSANLTGEETTPSALDRLIGAMQRASPMIQLCGGGLRVRVVAYEQLAGAQAKK